MCQRAIQRNLQCLHGVRWKAATLYLAVVYPKNVGSYPSSTGFYHFHMQIRCNKNTTAAFKHVPDLFWRAPGTENNNKTKMKQKLKTCPETTARYTSYLGHQRDSQCKWMDFTPSTRGLWLRSLNSQKNQGNSGLFEPPRPNKNMPTPCPSILRWQKERGPPLYNTQYICVYMNMYMN